MFSQYRINLVDDCLKQDRERVSRINQGKKPNKINHKCFSYAVKASTALGIDRADRHMQHWDGEFVMYLLKEARDQNQLTVGLVVTSLQVV